MQIKQMKPSVQMTLIAITLTLASVPAFSFELPNDWPQLKPGMFKTEMKLAGMKATTSQQCVTKAMLDEAKTTSDNALKAEKGCKAFEYSKSGAVHISRRECTPPGVSPFIDLIEVTRISSSELKTNSSRVERGNKTVFAQETHTTRLGDCTGKEPSKAGSLEGAIQKAMEEAQANSSKKSEK